MYFREPSPYLNPYPKSSPLPDGFRYKPDLAITNPAKHSTSISAWTEFVISLRSRFAGSSIKTLRKQHVDIPYQHRPGWQPAKSALKFTGDIDDKAEINKWVGDWKKAIRRIDNNMKLGRDHDGIAHQHGRLTASQSFRSGQNRHPIRNQHSNFRPDHEAQGTGWSLQWSSVCSRLRDMGPKERWGSDLSTGRR